MKTRLILVDGMRPDALAHCPAAQEVLRRSVYTLNAQTVMPSVTLPCHMSLFYSVEPGRHGTTTNVYTPQVRPIAGLCDAFAAKKKSSAFFYSWGELRDLCRPDHLHTYMVFNQHKQADTDTKITAAAIDYIREEQPDFLFLYLGETDEVGGHSAGWMSETYMGSVHKALGCIEKLYENLPEGYTLIVTADHGGHDRSHGTELPEDMTIPICFCGPRFEKNRALESVSIKDIAVTVAKLLEVPFVREWEGTPRV